MQEDSQPDALPPLTYWLPPDHEPSQCWTHEPYRNAAGHGITLEYCTDRGKSERIARQFLSCPIVGFDMEWAAFGAQGIKGNISVIQVACEDRIALFHIARYQGLTVPDLLCPSLRKLIESDTILKCGVAINNADGNRLRTWMNLEPRGMFELSHLYKVVKYYQSPAKINKKLVKLTHLTHEQLGRPLCKGDVRTSNWTKPLTEEQIRYAAADAYAGFRIFHALEAKRLKLTPIPPRPASAELGLPLRLADGGELMEEDAADQDTQGTSGVEGMGRQTQSTDGGEQPQQSNAQAPSGFRLPPIDLLAYDDPQTRRAFSAMKALRKRLGIELNKRECVLATDATLFNLAQDRPRCATDLAGARKRWAEILWNHAHLDLIRFLRKHAPTDLATPRQILEHDSDLGQRPLDEPTPPAESQAEMHEETYEWPCEEDILEELAQPVEWSQHDVDAQGIIAAAQGQAGGDGYAPADGRRPSKRERTMTDLQIPANGSTNSEDSIKRKKGGMIVDADRQLSVARQPISQPQSPLEELSSEFEHLSSQLKSRQSVRQHEGPGMGTTSNEERQQTQQQSVHESFEKYYSDDDFDDTDYDLDDLDESDEIDEGEATTSFGMAGPSDNNAYVPN